MRSDFQEQAEIELIGGEGLEVIGAVLGGGAVHVAAVVFNQDHVLALADVLGALEHHVLEQVREPGAPGMFAVRAHVVGDGDPVGGGGVIDRHDYAEAVVQLVLFDRNPKRFWLGLGL